MLEEINHVVWYKYADFVGILINSFTAYPARYHDDVIKWKHFLRYWRFVRRIHRSPVNSAHKGQWRGALMFSLICTWIYSWVNNPEAGDLRRYRAHCDVSVMWYMCCEYISKRASSSGGDDLTAGPMQTKVKDNIFLLISTIILLKVLTLCCPVQIETPCVSYWYNYVALYFYKEMWIDVSPLYKNMCYNIGRQTCATFIFRSLGL